MSVSLRDGRAFVSDQGHHDSIGNSGVFKQKAGSAWQYSGAGGAALGRGEDSPSLACSHGALVEGPKPLYCVRRVSLPRQMPRW